MTYEELLNVLEYLACDQCGAEVNLPEDLLDEVRVLIQLAIIGDKKFRLGVSGGSK